MTTIYTPSATATRMWALDAPTFTLDNGILIVGGAGQVTIPAPAFLIEHPKGLVLFDTSLVPQAATDPESVYGRDLVELIGLRFTPDQIVTNQIRQLGYAPEDVKYVVMSHFHFDHTGGMREFPNATFLVFQGEMRFAYWPDPAGAAFFLLDDLLVTRKFRWMELEDDHDVFGDGSLVFLHTPGHTPGEGSLVVHLPHRSVVLTGDTVHCRAALENLIPMPYDSNTEEALRSIRRLRQIRESIGSLIWISHDPDDWAEYARAPVAID